MGLGWFSEVHVHTPNVRGMSKNEVNDGITRRRRSWEGQSRYYKNGTPFLGAEVVVGAIPDDLRAWRGKTKATKSTTRAGQWQNTVQVIYGS